MLFLLRKVLQIYSRLKELLVRNSTELVLTLIGRTEKNGYVFVVMHNGYDYEVQVFFNEKLMYHSVGYATISEAETFINFYKNLI